MTGILERLTALVSALPSLPGGPWIVFGGYAEHAGDVVYAHMCDDEDPDGPDPFTFRIDEDGIAALLEDGIDHYIETESRDDARKHVMNTLVLRGIENDVEEP